MNIIILGAGIGNNFITDIINEKNVDNLLLVEANPTLISSLRTKYKESIIINKVINTNNNVNSTPFYYSKYSAPEYKNSSIDKNYLLKLGIEEHEISSIDIPCITLNDLLDEYKLVDIDYLYIDIGGIEADVILSANFQKYNIKNIEFNYNNIIDQSEKLMLKFTEYGYVQVNSLTDNTSNTLFTKLGNEISKQLSIDIILRTHSFIDIHPNPTPRYCGADKTTLIEKCVKSLVQSANNYDGTITFIWFDDHSSQDMIDRVHKVFSESKHPYEFHALEERGWNSSGHAQFDRGRASEADLVYFIEDDYLHYPTAIDEMVHAYKTFKRNLGVEIALHPYDDPDNYLPLFIDECRIVLGKNRHWRTNKYSTFTFMCNPEIVRKFWSRFYTVATEYMTEWGEKNEIQEGTTINHLWRWEVKLFTPIPSLALHMGYERQLDPFIDWKALWDSVG